MNNSGYNKTNWKAALCTGGSLLCELAFKILEVIVLRRNRKQSDDSAINEILIYGAPNGDALKKKTGLENLLCIYYLILHASRSIDVCVSNLGSNTTAKCFISAHQKNNVVIRITIHSSDDFHNLQLLAQNGIEVKIINPAVRLEHEFILIDASEESDDAVAVMGSLDYDTIRVNCNRDATVLTSDAIVVQSLKREFDRIWNSVAAVTHRKDDKSKE